MKSTHTISALMLIVTTGLVGCASNSPQQTSTSYATPSQSNTSSYGAIESIQVTRPANNSSGTGAIVGGLVGGLLGNQVGSGNGRTAATVVGAVGGAVVGNNVEQNKNAQAPDMYQIRVRLDNGDSTTVAQSSIADLRVGNRVRVADGRVYRY
ncbi:glycine zipper 2TM domain-containing protein [Undibacterium arcticum]|uniref:Glycine zipper 2TM domain-containing protein n=1 Tax=Undibacterium arcticum TaxID=1762892 RepID=A0ABV7F0T7_9BURK